MEGNKKRRAKRVYDATKDAGLSITTEELVARHLANSNARKSKAEANEKGKEDFDDLLFMMSKPDSD